MAVCEVAADKVVVGLGTRRLVGMENDGGSGDPALSGEIMTFYQRTTNSGADGTKNE